ncbi:hypothetical protein BH11CYA1_BH11CYA1_24020 [soil metagenome]
MVFFDKSTYELQDRWKGVGVDVDIDFDTIDFAHSPFGLTEDGLHDFRGLVIKRDRGDIALIQNKRFEKCDFSLSRFINCQIKKCWFVDCNLYGVDFHSCPVENSPMPNCKREMIIYFQRPALKESIIRQNDFSYLIKSYATTLPPELVVATRLDLLKESDFERAIVLCFDHESCPSDAVLKALLDELALAVNPPKLFVLCKNDYTVCSKPEQKLISTLFCCQPLGLGEIAWVKNQKVLKSERIAQLPIRETIAARLPLLDSQAGVGPQKAAEAKFWQIVDSALPLGPYDAQAHIELYHEKVMALSDEALLEFSALFSHFISQGSTCDLADAATLIGTGCGDDSLNDFAHNWILRGQSIYYNSIQNLDDTLSELDCAHLLLIEGFAYVISEVMESRGLELQFSLGIGGFAGINVNENLAAMKKKQPKLHKKYWNKKKYMNVGAVRAAASAAE